jgi:O-antigen ligase
MEFSIVDIFLEARFIEILSITIIGILTFVYLFSGKIHLIIFFLLLSASFVGASDSTIATIAPIARWIAVFYLLLYGAFFKKWRFSTGFIFFLCYIFFGFLFLFRAIAFDWQVQKSILLLIVSLAITLSFGNEDFESAKLSLLAISFAGTTFAFINFIPLINLFGEGSRFSGLLKSAPAFAMVLAGFLPFLMFTACTNNNFYCKIISTTGLGVGAMTLIMSGQRSGTIGGIISLLPFFLLLKNQIKILFFCFLFLGVFFSYFFTELVPLKKIEFLENRYSEISNLSRREEIWEQALQEIAKNPIFGSGIGASEQVIESSFHQTFLEIWFNAGLPGLIFYIASICYCGYRIKQLYGMSIQDRDRTFFIALSCGFLLSFLAMSFFESLGAAASNISIILFLVIMSLLSNGK